jgi:glucuronokinase
MISCAVPARAGILGNPSDGYGGRTLALAVPQFEATVSLEPADRIEILSAADDVPAWRSVGDLADHVDRFGYGTGTQLLAAAVRTFVAVAESVGCGLGSGFRLGYATTIPRQVGLGGSSALVVGALRCLSEHYQLDIPEVILPSVALRAETTQLGIAAGLQDRVVQTYGGLVAMDFGDMQVDTRFGISHGVYERLDTAALPPLFLAYRTAAAQPSGTYHQHLQIRYEAGDTVVRELLRELAALVLEGRAALRWGDADRFGPLIGKNMALRRSLAPLPDAQLELVDAAEAAGAHATFAGSGGAIVGTYHDDEHFEALDDAFADIGADLVRLEPPAGGFGDDDGAAADDHDEASSSGTLSGNVVALDRIGH